MQLVLYLLHLREDLVSGNLRLLSLGIQMTY